eukprot:snap_masked-scaffold_23-processed-gene-5.25-mRNA-1 protein AED:1.00 eAED:1.00 QI:0/-1/0/0/-1/1/1/0/993
MQRFVPSLVSVEVTDITEFSSYLKPNHFATTSYELRLSPNEEYSEETFTEFSNQLSTADPQKIKNLSSLQLSNKPDDPENMGEEYSPYEIKTNHSFGETGASEFIEALKQFDSLSYLRVNEIKINDEQIQPFCQFLGYNTTLTMLGLPFCGLSSTAAVLLAHELKFTNRSLLSLDLSFNSIGKTGLKSLASAIEVNDILTSISMSGNNLDDQSLKPLITALERNKTLCVFDLYLTPAHIANGENLSLIQNMLQGNLVFIKDLFNEVAKTADLGPIRKAKVCVVGQDSVGKSELVGSLLNKPFGSTSVSTEGFQITQVSTRLYGAWQQNGRFPEGKFGVQFLNRFCNVKLEEKVEEREKAANKPVGFARLKQRKNRRASIKQRRASIGGKGRKNRRGSVSASAAQEGQTVRSSALGSNVEKRGSVALSVLKSVGFGDEGGLSGKQAVRRNNIKQLFSKMGQAFTKNDDILNDSDYLFGDESNPNYTEEEIEGQGLLDVHLLAKARRQRDLISYNVLELAGNRIYYTVHHTLLGSKAVSLLTFSIPDLLSKEGNRQKDCIRYINYWLKAIRYHSSIPKILLVGTRASEVETNRIAKVERMLSNIVFPNMSENLDKKNVVEINDALEAANQVANELNGKSAGKVTVVLTEKKGIFFPVELSTGEGVDAIKKAVDKVAQELPGFKKKIPVQWIKFLDALRANANSMFMRSPAEVKEVGSEFFDQADFEGELNEVLEFFHELGYIVHLTEVDQLMNTVITDPMRFHECMYRLIFNSENKMLKNFDLNDASEDLENDIKQVEEYGIFTKPLMDFILGENVDETEKLFLLNYLQYNLIFSKYGFDGKDEYLMPSLVNAVEPTYEEHIETFGNGLDLKVLFNFKGYLTLGVFERLVCLCIQFSNKDAGNVAKPVLRVGWAEIESKNYKFRIVRYPDDIELQVLEARKNPVKLVNSVDKMMGRLAKFLGEGFVWDTVVELENNMRITFKDAKAKKLTQWFAK